MSGLLWVGLAIYIIVVVICGWLCVAIAKTSERVYGLAAFFALFVLINILAVSIIK